jgi:hypothetical protein
MRLTMVRNDDGHVVGGPSEELDQSCERIRAPSLPPPARNARDAGDAVAGLSRVPEDVT